MLTSEDKNGDGRKDVEGRKDNEGRRDGESLPLPSDDDSEDMEDESDGLPVPSDDESLSGSRHMFILEEGGSISAEELQAQISLLPPPSLPDQECGDVFLDYLTAFLQANGQDMETLGLVGKLGPVENFPPEQLRKCKEKERWEKDALKEPVGWQEIKRRRVNVNGRLYPNILSSRLDLVGAAIDYKFEVRVKGIYFFFWM
jgi:hypothetical protein